MNTFPHTRRFESFCLFVLFMGYVCQPCLAAPTVAPANIELIPPGTRVSAQAPEPWTHLIVKSQPRVTSGDINQVSATQIKLASKYFLATLAQVERLGEGPATRYELARLASGIGVNINGQDTIISPSTASRLGARVGFQGGILLREMYDEQQTVQILLRSPTCAVYDTPIVLRVGQKNDSEVLRYGVMVNAETGQLDVLAWLVDINGRGDYLQLSGHLQWLPPNLLLDCRLHVDASEYFLGIPNDRAFACLSIPRGRVQLSVVDQSFENLLTKQRWTVEEATSMEALLHKAIQQAGVATNK